MTSLNPNKLGALLKRHVAGPSTTLPERVVARVPIDSLLFAFLLWEASTDDAAAAWTRIREATIDDNDLRISLAFELVEIIGPRYPRAQERAERLRASFNDIYRREHAVSLDRITQLGKREQRAYVESLEGMAPFVAARMLLSCYGVHGVPMDDRVCAALVAAGAVEENVDPQELSATLGRQVKADQAEAVHMAMLAAADAHGVGSASKSAGKTTASGSTRPKRSGGRTSGGGRKGRSTGRSGSST